MGRTGLGRMGWGTTTGRVLAGAAGTQPVAYATCQWTLAVQINESKGKQKVARGDRVSRVRVLVCRINQTSYLHRGQMYMRTRQPVRRAQHSSLINTATEPCRNKTKDAISSLSLETLMGATKDT